MVVFDLDGTLVDTQNAVRAAYRAAGVEMPDGAWGRPWREWLTEELCNGRDPERIHDRKNREYPHALLHHAQAMPLLKEAVRLNSPIITGASREAVRLVESRFIVKLNVVRCSASKNDKCDYLSAIDPGVYVDDDEETRQLIEEKTQWRAIHPRDFQRSFLRPARTNVFGR